MTRVKICGIRTVDNALMVAGAGAGMIGLNFYPKSPRYIEPSLAREIANCTQTRIRPRLPNPYRRLRQRFCVKDSRHRR